MSLLTNKWVLVAAAIVLALLSVIAGSLGYQAGGGTGTAKFTILCTLLAASAVVVAVRAAQGPSS